MAHVPEARLSQHNRLSREDVVSKGKMCVFVYVYVHVRVQW